MGGGGELQDTTIIYALYSTSNFREKYAILKVELI